MGKLGETIVGNRVGGQLLIMAEWKVQVAFEIGNHA